MHQSLSYLLSIEFLFLEIHTDEMTFEQQLAMISIDVFKSIAVEIQLHEKEIM